MAAKILSFEWDSQSVVAVEATKSRRNTVSLRASSANWPAGIDPNTAPREAGVWLGRFLHESGMSADYAVITIPRNQVIVKHVKLPATSTNDLPEVMRLQAEGRALIPPEKLRFDFVPLPSTDDSNETNALLAMLDTDVLATYQSIAENAGQKVAAIGITPVAATEVLNKSVGDQVSDCDLVLTHGEGRLEITAVGKEGMFASHSHVLDSNPVEPTKLATNIVSAIRRFQATLKYPNDTTSANQVWILDAPENDGLVKLIEEKLRKRVHAIDPVSGCGAVDDGSFVGDRCRYVGPIGMLLSNIQPTVSAFNFIAPRKPRSHRIRIISAISAIAALVLLASFAACLHLSNRREALDRNIELLTKSESNLQTRNKERESALQLVGVVDEWAEDDVFWIDELLHLVKRMPSSQRTYFSSLRFHSNYSTGVPKIKGSGYAREPDDVMNFNKELLKSREHYQIYPHGFQPSQSDIDYPTRFEFEVDLVTPQDTEKSEDNDG